MVRNSIQRSIKLLYTFYLFLLIPGFWNFYGWVHFLWLSHFVLLLAYFATLFESKFLASMAAVGYIAYAIGWTLDYLYTLISPTPAFTQYMLNEQIPLVLRILSLFHILLIPFLLWIVFRLGYDRRAWPFQIGASSLLLWLTWIVQPNENINLVYGYLAIGWKAVPFLILLSLINAMIIFATHKVLHRIYR